MGDITVKYNGKTTAPINAGTYQVTADISGNVPWYKVEDIQLGSFKINPKPLYNVSAKIPNVTLNSPKTLEDQILLLKSPNIEDGDIVSGVCDITFTQTSKAGIYHTASAKVKSLTNNNYIFTGTLQDQDCTVLQKALIGMKLKHQPNKLNDLEGEKIDLRGVEVTLLYDDGTQEDVVFENFAEKNISVKPANQTILSISEHHSKPVTVNCDIYSVDTQKLTVTATKVVKTEDNTSMLLWIIFAGLSTLAFVILVSKNYKSSHD